MNGHHYGQIMVSPATNGGFANYECRRTPKGLVELASEIPWCWPSNMSEFPVELSFNSGTNGPSPLGYGLYPQMLKTNSDLGMRYGLGCTTLIYGIICIGTASRLIAVVLPLAQKDWSQIHKPSRVRPVDGMTKWWMERANELSDLGLHIPQPRGASQFELQIEFPYHWSWYVPTVFFFGCPIFSRSQSQQKRSKQRKQYWTLLYIYFFEHLSAATGLVCLVCFRNLLTPQWRQFCNLKELGDRDAWVVHPERRRLPRRRRNRRKRRIQ